MRPMRFKTSLNLDKYGLLVLGGRSAHDGADRLGDAPLLADDLAHVLGRDMQLLSLIHIFTSLAFWLAGNTRFPRSTTTGQPQRSICAISSDGGSASRAL